MRMLFKAVSDTHNATFPLSRWFKRFDAEPPGHAEMIINPTFISGAKSVKLMMVNAMRGRRIIWANNPIKMGFGNRNTLTKSCRSNESPIPNMIMISTAGKKYVDTKDAATGDSVLQNSSANLKIKEEYMK